MMESIHMNTLFLELTHVVEIAVDQHICGSMVNLSSMEWFQGNSRFLQIILIIPLLLIILLFSVVFLSFFHHMYSVLVIQALVIVFQIYNYRGMGSDGKSGCAELNFPGIYTRL